MHPGLLLFGLPSALAPQESPPTFTRDVAPIVFESCAACHQPGQSAPFDLLTYDDLARRARQVVEVTASGSMPPWLPERGLHTFEHDRSLDATEIETLRRWFEAGAPEGDPADLPEPPVLLEGWALGTPDLVLEPSVAYQLAAGGGDVFRNLVIANPEGGMRFVRAVEVRPGSPAVHHAILQLDRGGGCRRDAEESEEPGFGGMSMGTSEPPDGHFIGWTPGHAPRAAADDMAWRLPPRSDLVLQVHLTPTGKVESIRPRIGLYFTDRAPSVFPYSIVLYREDIDIPAGEAAYTVRDEYVLPTDVELHGIYPHAHYLGQRVRVTAHRPEGGTEELLRIDDWDFNWQGEYRYQRPFVLPAGTRLRMEWTYDNSTGNVRNPNQPPERVVFGQSSSDEMGTASLQVIPVHPEHMVRLHEARWRITLERKPWDWHACNTLAALLIEDGRLEQATPLLQRALQRNPDYPDALANLGLVLQRGGHLPEAAKSFLRALDLQPDHPGANARLGATLAALGQRDQALEHLETVLARWPHLHESHVEMGNLLALGGEPERAVGHYVEALRLYPGLPEAHNNLANTFVALGEPLRAIEQYRLAVAARPDYFNAHFNLGRTLLAQGEAAEGLRHLEQAVQLRPEDERARTALEDARR